MCCIYIFVHIYVYTDTQTILCTYKTSSLYAYIKPTIIMPGEKPAAISHGQEKNRGPAHPRALKARDSHTRGDPHVAANRLPRGPGRAMRGSH